MASVFSRESQHLRVSAPDCLSLDPTLRTGQSFAQRVGCVRLGCKSTGKFSGFRAVAVRSNRALVSAQWWLRASKPAAA
jgi:pimeloyl-CoA synthetase